MSIRTTARIVSKALALTAVLACAGLFTGCGGFWSAITTTTTTNTGTGFDLVYAGKNNSNSFVGYAITASGLTAVTGSPFSIASAPLSMAITPADTYLYVGTILGIYGYAIPAGGALTTLNSGAVVANTPAGLGNGPVSMDISPDGNWLAVLTNNSAGLVSIFLYQITTGTGLLTYANTVTVPVSASAVVHTIKFSPNEALLVATLGTSGTDIFTFTASNGSIGSSYVPITPASNLYSDNDAVINTAGTTLYLTRGGSDAELWLYSINATTGAVIAGTPVPTGNNPTALSFSNATTQPYLYLTNANASTINGYSITTNSGTGAITVATLGTSPYSALGTAPNAIAFDNSDTYMVAMNQAGPPDLIEYTVDSTPTTAGRLYVTGSVNTGLSTLSGTLGPGVTMATTH